MKKVLSIIGCVILLAASSCTKKYITPNPNATYFATINPSDWVLSSDGKSYTAPIDIQDLTPDFNHYGGVIVAISYSTSSSNDEVYEQLPEVYGGTSFSYTYNAGNVAIYAQSPDGATPIKPTDPISAKIILVASE
ncbi:MAG: hypothetical protein ACXVJD_04650 [Mucilaginibacter sp.]